MEEVLGSTNEKNGELGYRIKPLLNLVTAMGKHQRGDYLFMCLIVLIYKKIYEILVFYWNGMSCDQKFRDESKLVKDFSDECRFWVARKPESIG